ncbi:Tctex-1 family-domain-containing protein [Phlyctochytrium arcticum]|nr:Tctex-1 family-domain-containing protein [Phlyctochytrium arcticum]
MPEEEGSTAEQHQDGSRAASREGTPAAPASAGPLSASGIRGSRQLAGSRSNLLAASRHGSRGDIVPRAGAAPELGGGGGGPPPGTASGGEHAPANAVVFENTFKMKPDVKFQSEPVRRLAQEILQTTLQKVKYDGEKIPQLCQSISNEILAAVKKFEYERYKIVVDVTIGEFKGQGIRVASRALWDTTTDSYASASFKNASLFAVAIVFGCYLE